MLVAAHEHQAAALVEPAPAPKHLVHIGQDLDPRARRLTCQQLLLHRAHHQGDVAGMDQRQFLFPRLGGGAGQLGAAGQLGGALFAQIVQIHGIEGQRRVRCMQPHQINVAGGDVVARDDHQVQPLAVLREPGDRIGQMRMPQHFHAQLLQLARIRLHEGTVVGEEGHRVAVLAQKPQDIAQPQRA